VLAERTIVDVMQRINEAVENPIFLRGLLLHGRPRRR
jgi:hypothetical protein